MNIKCLECNNEFKRRRKTNLFCSKFCSIIWRHKNGGFPNTTKGQKRPHLTGENNPAKRPEVRAKISQKLSGRNITWGKKIAKSRSWYKPTIETRLRMKISHLKRVSDGKHNNYKGGITPVNTKIRHSPEYKLWRESVFKRDNYTCRNCRKRGGALEANHIKPFCDYPELRLDINNGETLCKECHKTVTKKQLKKIWKNQYLTSKKES